MIHSLKTLAFFAGAALIVASSVATAAPSSWSMPAGDHGSYTYSGGQTANGNFGTGTAFSDGFFFVPPSLKAQTNGQQTLQDTAAIAVGSSDSASDTISVILNAKPNTTFTHIASNILGDFSIFGVGEVNSTGTLRVTNLDTSLTLSSPLNYGGTLPALTTSSSDGVFQGLAGLDLPAGWKNIRVELDGMVSAQTLQGTALIQAKDAEIGVTTAEIPIPAALAVAPIAAFLGWRAKRKFGAAR